MENKKTSLEVIDTGTGEIVTSRNIRDVLKAIALLPEQSQSELLTRANELRKVLDKVEKQIKIVAREKAVEIDDNHAEWFGHMVTTSSTPRFDEDAMIANEDKEFVEKYKAVKQKYVKFTISKKVI